MNPNTSKTSEIHPNQEESKELTLEQLQDKSNAMRKKYPDSVPVVVKKSQHTKIPELTKHRYIVPGDCTVEVFLKKLAENKPKDFPGEKKQLYLFIDNVLVNTKAVFSDLDRKYSSEDGFLYMVYSGEYTWGKFSSTFLNMGQSS